jgi:hypothetical protein
LEIGDIPGALGDAEEAIRIAPRFPQVLALVRTSKVIEYNLSCTTIFMFLHPWEYISVRLKKYKYQYWMSMSIYAFDCFGYELAWLPPINNVSCNCTSY